MTETSSVASTESNIVNSYKYAFVGKPLFNNKIKIIKKNKGKYGEILIKGKNIFKEYLDDKKELQMLKKRLVSNRRSWIF